MACDSDGGNFFRMMLTNQEIQFQLIPNVLYYFDAVDWENNMLLLKTGADNREGFTWQE